MQEGNMVVRQLVVPLVGPREPDPERHLEPSAHGESGRIAHAAYTGDPTDQGGDAPRMKAAAWRLRLRCDAQPAADGDEPQLARTPQDRANLEPCTSGAGL